MSSAKPQGKKEIAKNQGRYWGDLHNFLDAYGIEYKSLDDVANVVNEGIYIPSPAKLRSEVEDD